jgi:hypothetical protein
MSNNSKNHDWKLVVQITDADANAKCSGHTWQEIYRTTCNAQFQRLSKQGCDWTLMCSYLKTS